MLEITVSSDFTEVQRMFNHIPGLTEQAATTALNKTIKNVQTTTVREISRETGIKPQKKVKEALVIKKARRNYLVSVLSAKPRVFNLIEFVAPSKRNTRAFRKKKGVTARAWGKTKQYKNTFIAPGRNSNKMLVFKRTTNKPLPPKEVKGPSVPRTFVQKTIERAMKKRAAKQWVKNFNHDMRRRLRRYGYD